MATVVDEMERAIQSSLESLQDDENLRTALAMSAHEDHIKQTPQALQTVQDTLRIVLSKATVYDMPEADRVEIAIALSLYSATDADLETAQGALRTVMLKTRGSLTEDDRVAIAIALSLSSRVLEPPQTACVIEERKHYTFDQAYHDMIHLGTICSTLKRVNVPGDGSCFFHAIWRQLQQLQLGYITFRFREFADPIVELRRAINEAQGREYATERDVVAFARMYHHVRIMIKHIGGPGDGVIESIYWSERRQSVMCYTHGQEEFMDTEPIPQPSQMQARYTLMLSLSSLHYNSVEYTS
jgi:hypothetical protein